MSHFKPHFNDEYFSKLTAHLTELDEKKYKHGLTMLGLTFSTDERQRLDTYFGDCQRKLERANGTPKG